jgi:hypothetical protein
VTAWGSTSGHQACQGTGLADWHSRFVKLQLPTRSKAGQVGAAGVELKRSTALKKKGGERLLFPFYLFILFYRNTRSNLKANTSLKKAAQGNSGMFDGLKKAAQAKAADLAKKAVTDAANDPKKREQLTKMAVEQAKKDPKGAIEIGKQAVKAALAAKK